MQTSGQPAQIRHENNFDFMRFVLASLVIVSHAPVLLDGNEAREPLSMLTADHLTLGAMSVNGFFLLSGFLILQSWQTSRSVWNYFAKRILRIYPGFIVATLFSVFVAGTLGMVDKHSYLGSFDTHRLFFILKRMLTLRIPPVPETFAGLPFSSVNGAIWTVRYEFICYVGVAALGLFLVYRKRALVPLLGVLALGAFTVQNLCPDVWSHLRLTDDDNPFLGVAKNWPRFATYFCTGMFYYSYRDKIRFNDIVALVCLAVVLISVRVPHLAQVTIPTLGAYCFFAFGFSKSILLHNFGKFGDFSYGMFLYGWPVMQLMIWYCGKNMHPAVLCAATLVGAFVMAFLSWHCVEKPCLRLKKRAHANAALVTNAAAPSAKSDVMSK